MATITSTGLGSGIDINSLVGQLVAADRTPASNRLDRQESSLQAKISALGVVKSSLNDVRTAVDALKDPSKFQGMQTVSSDNTVVSASATGTADVADYQLSVKKLAQAHGLGSKRFQSVTDTVGTGTLTIKFGTTSFDGTGSIPNGFTQNADKGTLTLTVDSSNNTLAGLREAINKANAGVRASIVNDGGGYRLVLNSADSGAKNSMEISVSDPGNSGLAAFSFNAASAQMTQLKAAQDAVVSINGLDVTSSTNTVSNALEGVTLRLLKTSDAVVNMSVAPNNGDITKAVQGLVDKFNAAVDMVSKTSNFNATTKQAGVLSGEASVRGAIGQLRALISQPVEGLTGSVRSLLDIGVKTEANGKLALDTTKLNSALAANRDDVIALFAPVGQPSDSGVSYLASTTDTKPGTYALSVTSAATRGALNGAANPASLVVDGSNDTFKVKVDGVASGAIQLSQSNTYTTHSLAAELQSRINGDSALKADSISVAVTYNSSENRFVIQSQRYGSASTVQITQVGAEGSGATVGGLGVGTGTAGQDAVATLDGKAVGASGRQLTGTSDTSKGLKLALSDDLTGARGTVRFTRGLAEQFGTALGGILDTNGTVDARLKGLQKSVEQISTQRTKLDDRLQTLQQRLLKQFNDMDTIVSQFQSVGNYMTQALANLPGNYDNSN